MRALLLCLLFAPALTVAQTAQFFALGDLAGGDVSSEARGISPDGRVVVGNSAASEGTMGFKWVDGVLSLLNDLSGGSGFAMAYDAALTGRAVGRGAQLGGFRGVYWDAEPASILPMNGSNASSALGISADASTIVGFSGSTAGLQACRWVSGGSLQLMGDLPGGIINSRANAVSDNGAVMVGQGASAQGRVAARWVGGSVIALGGTGDLPGGAPAGEAFDVSSDGSVAVGKSLSANGDEAFRWTLDGDSLQALGDLDGGAFYSAALGVSGDGSVIVGESTSATGTEAFIWTAEDGMRPLKAVLESEFGVVLTNWTLNSARAVSADGFAIVGSGTNPSGIAEGWLVRLPSDVILVTEAGDESDTDTDDGLCDVDAQTSGEQCTLRAAIEEANQRAGRDSIAFDIEGDGVPVISPTRALPDITEAVVIDGSTQPAGLVHLDGAASAPADGLRAPDGDGLTVRGLAITAFPRFGIRLAGGSGHLIEENIIGYLPDSTSFAPNLVGGIRVENGARDSEIGGRTAASENLVNGGISIVDDATRGIAVFRNRLSVPAEWMGAQIVRMPIDLDDSGPTCAEWENDDATGPNLEMPAPRLLEIAPTFVRGRTRPGATVVIYRVNFGGAQWSRYWPRIVVPLATSDADGEGEFIATLDQPLALGTRITATATDAQGNTSELAQMKRPVIFLPGVGGTWLVADNDSQTLWIPTQLTDTGANNALARMALTDAGLSRPEDPVSTDGVVESILGLSKVYGPAVEHLQDAGYAGDPANSARATNDLWRFPNDWRLTATGLASELKTLIHELTDGAADVARSCQVDLVAHSNGGVIASVYLRGLGASESQSRVNRVLTSGTPYLGAVQPAAAHTSGYLFELEDSLPGLDLDWGRMIGMARSLPGAYALMPSNIYWTVDRGLSGLTIPRGILEDMDGEVLESNPATINFLTRAKEVGGLPSGLARLDTLWRQERTTVQAVIGDWRTYDGPPQIFRHVGNVEASTAISFFLPDPPTEIPEGDTNRSEDGDTDRHRGYREGLSTWRGFGDGTVPLTSSTLGWDTRVGQEDYSGEDRPWIEPFEEYPCLHVPLVDVECTANGQLALDRIVEVLKGSWSVVPARAERRTATAAPRELIYVWANTPVRVWLDDDQGNSTGPSVFEEPNRILYDVPDAVYDATLLGASLSVPADRAYTVRAEAAGAATVRVARQRVAAGDTERQHVLFGDAVVTARGGVRLTMPASGTPASTSLALDADGDGTYEGTLSPGLEVTNGNGMIPVPVPRPSAVTLAVPTGQITTVELDFPDVAADGWTWTLAEEIPWLTPMSTSGVAPSSVSLNIDATALGVGSHEASITATLSNDTFQRVLHLPVRLIVSPPVAGEEAPTVTTVTRLLPPAPNPTGGRATITAELAEAGPLRVEVIDALGRVVVRLSNGPHAAGAHSMDIDAVTLPAGVYVVRMRSAAGVATERLTVVR